MWGVLRVCQAVCYVLEKNMVNKAMEKPTSTELIIEQILTKVNKIHKTHPYALGPSCHYSYLSMWLPYGFQFLKHSRKPVNIS